ncbi:PD-(D/E)XK nuclease family protein [uncultured Bacteroides sp.]|uniref:PDDEXK-like family protein n=1 Tax=uncultured Bacteroides sp. TaxID=162156 RepID=UPI0025952DDC|nr:PD-(D/E)XK nuclease family protein [uncultured Bacteroides sp.]
MNGIQSLFDKICLLNQAYKRLEDEKGENYNLFKVIDMTSNETSVHSAFLADLLNPKGLHHIGDVFLRLFTDEFLNGMSFSTETAIVEREKYIGPVTATTGGRLDIIVTDADRKAIIIENKIYASDQENQLIRYHNYAEKNTSEHKLFYLSLDGTVHDEDKTAKHDNKELIEEEHYFTISYESDILKWLEQCREKVVNKPLIREGISHYINLIKHLTNQTISKEMEKDLKDLILENPKYIQNLGIIREAINLSVVELQRRFWELLKKKMEEFNNDDNDYSVIEKGEYRYALDEKEDRINKYYKGNLNNKRYGFEFLVNRCGKYEIRYAVRMDEPMVYGFFIRGTEDNKRKISNNQEFDNIINTISESLPIYKPDKAGYYLGEIDWDSKQTKFINLQFKKLDSETLSALAKMDETVSKIAYTIKEDIDTLREKTKNLRY